MAIRFDKYIRDFLGNIIFGVENSGAAPASRVVIKNAQTGGASTLNIESTDADSGLDITPKGAGALTVGSVTVPTISSTNTLTNKTISGASNTLSNIPQSAVLSLTNNLNTIAGFAAISTGAAIGYDSGYYYDQSSTRGGFGTKSSSINNIKVTPYYCPQTFTCDQIGLNVTTAPPTAANFKVGIYSTDSTLRPLTLLWESSNIPITSGVAGYYFANPAFQFQALTMYFLSVKFDTAGIVCSSQAISSGSPQIIGLTSATTTASSGYFSEITKTTTSYATPSPTTWTYSPAEKGVNISPYSIRFRVQ